MSFKSIIVSSSNRITLSFKERAGVRMGYCFDESPIPALRLPLKGRIPAILFLLVPSAYEHRIAFLEA
jgi:hypothetical protein